MPGTQQYAGPVLLFPGQGGFDGVALTRAADGYPQVRAVFERIDTVTRQIHGRELSATLLCDTPVELTDLLRDEPWVSQLAIYASGLAAHRVLTEHGVRPSALVGHSLGEITALVAAGGYSVEDGARIVLRRTAAIAGLDGGSGAMIALAAAPSRARHLIALVENDRLAVATENHATQTVLSGPREAIGQVKAVAEQLRIGCAELDAAFAFHNPSLASVAPDFAAAVRDLPRGPLSVPVYSPILQRFYDPDESLGDRLADHFTLPVRFSSAVTLLHERGARVFVEAGGRATLTSLVPKVLGGPDDVTSLSTLSVGRGNTLRLADTLAELRRAGLSAGDGLDSLRQYLAPELTAAEFSTFWTTTGHEITALVSRRLSDFRTAPQNEPAGTAEPAGTDGAAEAPDTGARPAASVEVPGREEVFATVRGLYARALEYPEEVFTPGVLLEAELGVDSVKQVELLSRASEHFGLEPRGADFRLADHETLDKVADLIHQELGTRRGAVGTEAPDTGAGPAASVEVPGREEVFATVRGLYARALEYPEEVFTPGVLLEAELGVDSVKQVELLSRASEHFGLEPRGADFRLADHETLDKVADLIHQELNGRRLQGAAA
ncbi:acyltransferase domain-containing protein [Streptomyces lusitanus]|uniref:Acyltransferase domain-containing protein n=1 Tax=Streptomyces lusitanus TaxID=68232 RepID=A0ABU3JLL8_9ACTN|nr:acyltransferase domain-containing protein [Streptomyces lusitanus]